MDVIWNTSPINGVKGPTPEYATGSWSQSPVLGLTLVVRLYSPAWLMFLYVMAVTSAQYQFPSSARSAVPRQSCAAVRQCTAWIKRHKRQKVQSSVYAMLMLHKVSSTVEDRDKE